MVQTAFAAGDRHGSEGIATVRTIPASITPGGAGPTLGGKVGQRRPVIAGLAIGGVAALAILVGGGPVGRPPTGPSASPMASQPTVAGNGPVVFYEIDDADGAMLMIRTLDGRSLARLVASRTDIDMPRTWSVDPSGTTAIAATRRAGGDGTRLEGVVVGTGATIWGVDVPPAGVVEGVWSTDGRRFATTTAPDDRAAREVLVVDATNGAFARTTIPEGAVLQGFDPNGALVLRQRWPTLDGSNVGWQFLRIDSPTGEIERLAGPPVVGPASGWSEDVDPATGTGFDTAVAADDESKTVLRAWSLASRTNRVVGTFPTIDRLAMAPSGSAVAVSVQQSIHVVGRDGRATEAWRGADPASTFDWSTGGDFLAVATADADPALFVVERSSGRVVNMPLPTAIASAAFVDPAGRAVAGRLADPGPVLIGHLARRGLDIRISADERLALVRDRTETTELIQLGTGRSWPIDRGATTSWASGG
jgi:hypothetical protein